MKEKSVEPLRAAELMLVALANAAKGSMSELRQASLGLDVWELAALAGLLTRDEAKERRNHFLGGNLDDIPEYGHLMAEKGWIDYVANGPMPAQVAPRAAGLEHARNLTRPWYQKVWEYLKGDVRSVVAAVVTAIVTTLLMKSLGLG